MAKEYRGFKFTYNTNTYTIEARTATTDTDREEFITRRRTLDGTLYEQALSTGEKIKYNFNFSLCNTDLFDFFDAAYAAKLSGYTIVFSIENDSGTYDDINAAPQKPQYGEDTIGTDGKLYKNFTVEVWEI